MSINHFYSEGLWWGQQPQYHHHHNHHNMDTSPKSSSGTTTVTNTNSNSNSFWGNSQFHHHPIASSTNPSPSSLNFDLNNEDDEETVDEHPDRENHRQRIFKAEEEEAEKEIPKEPLFEKPLTPSDVGKLNRLVIPKQHAEKHFPLNGNDSGGEKGLLLSFEDELGKPWRFRYSYWNSSQSYVLTKGWSRFVKEKRLDAGDIVLFERHRLDVERLFIGWRRRNSAAAVQDSAGVAQAAVGGGGGGWTRVYFSSGHNNPYPAGAAATVQQPHHNHHRHGHGHGPGFPYQPDCLHAGGGGAVSVGQHNQTTATSANSKTLRLFGVNLECQPQQAGEGDSDQFQPQQSDNPPEGSSTSSNLPGLSHHHSDQQGQQGYYQFQSYYPKVHHPAYFNHHNHMNINFSKDASHTRYWQG